MGGDCGCVGFMIVLVALTSLALPNCSEVGGAVAINQKRRTPCKPSLPSIRGLFQAKIASRLVSNSRKTLPSTSSYRLGRKGNCESHSRTKACERNFRGRICITTEQEGSGSGSSCLGKVPRAPAPFSCGIPIFPLILGE